MGLTTKGRNQKADVQVAFDHIASHPGADATDIANVLGTGARYGREIVALLLDLLVIKRTDDDANAFELQDRGIVWSDVEAALDYRTSKAKKADATEKRAAATGSCKCGCGAPTSNSRRLYRPGHDARHAGQVARAIAAGQVTLADGLAQLPSDALRIKARDMVARLQAKAQAAEPIVAETFKVKRGRWTYPAQRMSDGTEYRNTKRDGSGDWVRM